LDFETTTPQDWFCIDGGTQQVASLMAEKLKGRRPQFNRQVTAIIADTEKGSVSLKIKHNEPDSSEIEKREYFTVFNSTTLGALQQMDLTQAKLLYGTKQAIRSLAYGASCKVGMKFQTPWWMLPPHNIKQGGMGKTDLPLRVCVYPSYNVHDMDNEPAVLLCSYTWAQDAQRIGALIKPDSPIGEEELKEVLFHNLALLHATDDKPYDVLLPFIKDQYITHHAWDWYCDPNMVGAFAYFGPGQFSNMWPEIIKPNGWLFLIGEAASAHHAWIVGALESAVRGIYQLLEQLELGEHAADFTSYADAMKLLREPEGDDKKLPFGGLPRELPIRQEGTKKGAELQDTPEAKDLDMSFVAAQCIASFYELLIELAKEEGGEVK
jgi:monoamine oxidase